MSDNSYVTSMRELHPRIKRRAPVIAELHGYDMNNPIEILKELDASLRHKPVDINKVHTREHSLKHQDLWGRKKPWKLLT